MGLEETKSAFKGWRDMQKGAGQTRQERLIKEQEERSQRIKNGQPLTEEDNGYKPGQESGNEPFSMRKAKDFLQKMTEQKKAQKIFKGSADQCMLKIASLMGCLPDEGRTYEKGKVLLVEQAGFGMYKITYMPG